MLIQRGLVKNRDPKTFFRETVFAGSHDASMRALLNGHVDAIASFDMAREQYLKDPAERERLAWVAETPPIPEAGIAARDGLEPALFARVRGGPPSDPRARPRSAAQAALRHRRLRAGRGSRVRPRAAGRRPAGHPSPLSADLAPVTPSGAGSPAAAPRPSAAGAMIEIAGLRVVLPPSTAALDGVDLTVRPGEFVVILGRSGAGKTTLLRSINRLVEPTSGTVRVAGRDVTGAGPAALREARRQVGMIFQQFNLVRRASVLDNVLAGRLGHVRPLPSLLGRFPEADRAAARACLEQVGLAHLAARRADTLSGRRAAAGRPSPARSPSRRPSSSPTSPRPASTPRSPARSWTSSGGSTSSAGSRWW